jgi:phospholipid-transporting ATPase
VERITNFQILLLFGCLLAISLVYSIGQTIWKYQYGNAAWYMDLNCKSSNARYIPHSPHIVSHLSATSALFSVVFKLLFVHVCVLLSFIFMLPLAKYVFAIQVKYVAMGNNGIPM